MDLLRFLFLLPVRLLRIAGRALGLVLRPLLGEVRWSAPGWMRAVRRHPLRSAGILLGAVVLAGGGWYGWRWYQQRPRPPEPSEAAEAPPVDAAEREALIDRVLRDVLEDPESGFRNVAVLYQDFLVRCRIQRVPGEPLALPAFRRRLAIGRARVSEEVAARGEWQRVLDLSERLPDDVQTVFLAIAHAAVTGEPCPADAMLAQIYGTHSVSRALQLLTYFEEENLVVVRTDFHGRRIVAFPDLGVETAPGDPASLSAAS